MSTDQTWILAASGWIASGIIAYIYQSRLQKLKRHADAAQQSANRRREFRATIRLMKNRLESVDWREFKKAWESTRTEFESACVRVEEDIAKDKLAGFKSAKDQYINRMKPDRSYPAGKGFPEMPVGNFNEIQREMQKILVPILDEIIEYAKDDMP